MRASLVLAPVLLALTACLPDGLDPEERIGLVSVRAFSNAGTPVVRGAAVFYRLRGYPLTVVGPQECATFSYVPPNTGDNAGQTLNAGANVTFNIGAFSEPASPTPGATYPVYNFADGSYLDFAGGDSVLVTIPGAANGFEAVTIKGRLAEPFTAAPLPTFVENTPMDLTWQPAAAPGSVMLVALRYNSNPDATTPNIEIACAFDDDGSGQIPAAFANAYGTAGAAAREYAFIRVRDRIIELDDRTRARVRSIFEVPTTSLVNAP
jgi:hypothetical protein